ncbi:MAG: FliM/FliN family flagellar motor C-terminal domain-containing protein [Kofleriaceae bacterium]
MSDGILDPQEMEAIQAAMRETAPRRAASRAEVLPTRLALIADDRTAEVARPILIDLATRAIRTASRALKPHLPGSWQLDVVGAEILDGAAVKEELRGGWVAGMAAPDGAEIVIAAHGGVIDIAAARRCGAAQPTADSTRAPSSVALRLFQPAGRSVLDSWIVAWREVFASELAVSTDLSIVSRLIEARTIVRVALMFSGTVSGRIQIYARPDILVPRPSALAAFKANAVRIANVLSNVPVEVMVELGTLRLRLRELRRIEPGATFTLQGFVDSRVPVYCEGVLKAWARPVVCRGVLAVQIESVVHGQGTRS